jgi:hypothetical protein
MSHNLFFWGQLDAIFFLCLETNPYVQVAWKGNNHVNTLWKLLNVARQPSLCLFTLIFVGWFIVFLLVVLTISSISQMISTISHGYIFWRKSFKYYKHLRVFIPRWKCNLLLSSCWFYAMITSENMSQKSFLLFALK